MAESNKNPQIDVLYRLIVSLESVEDCEALFEDLCTRKEVEKWLSVFGLRSC